MHSLKRRPLCLAGALFLLWGAGAREAAAIGLQDIDLTINPFAEFIVEYTNWGGPAADALVASGGLSGADQLEWNLNKVLIAFRAAFKGRIQLLIELLPVAEHFPHNVTALNIRGGVTVTDPGGNRLRGDPALNMELLERVTLTVRDVLPRNDLIVGVLRNPFGFWDDFTLHRSSGLIKINAIVNGVALKSFNPGIKLEGRPVKWLNYRLAVMRGHKLTSSISPPEAGAHAEGAAGAATGAVGHGHAESAPEPDIAGRIGVVTRWFEAGANGELFGSTPNKLAVGGDLLVLLGDLTLQSEVVFQRNSIDRFRSFGVYGNVRYDLSSLVEGLNVFAFYEYWMIDFFDVRLGDNHKAYVGGRYVITRGVTAALEYGVNIHNILDMRHHYVDLLLALSF